MSSVRSEKILQKHYYDAKVPGSFGGVENLYKAVKKHGIKKKDLLPWLNHQDAYTLHKPVRKKFVRNMIVVSDIDSQWQADLVSMIDHSGDNNGIKYILTVIDVLSKYAWCVGLRDKTAASVARAFEVIFEHERRVPQKLQTDRGREFMNKPMKRVCRNHNIHHFFTTNTVKAALVERFNRTLKTKMWRYLTKHNTFRYINILPDLVYSYNRTYHTTIRCRPVDVTKNNSLRIWRRIYSKTLTAKPIKPCLKIGDHVRISQYKGAFSKGYEQSYTDEIFVIDAVNTKFQKPMYKIADLSGEAIDGSFYKEEIQKVPLDENRVYRIEKILKKRRLRGKTFYFIKWRGYPTKFNSWIEENQLTDV